MINLSQRQLSHLFAIKDNCLVKMRNLGQQYFSGFLKTYEVIPCYKQLKISSFGITDWFSMTRQGKQSRIYKCLDHNFNHLESKLTYSSTYQTKSINDVLPFYIIYFISTQLKFNDVPQAPQLCLYIQIANILWWESPQGNLVFEG